MIFTSNSSAKYRLFLPLQVTVNRAKLHIVLYVNASLVINLIKSTLATLRKRKVNLTAVAHFIATKQPREFNVCIVFTGYI